MNVLQLLISILSVSSLSLDKMDLAREKLLEYRNELSVLRKEFGGSVEIPDVHFFLFGMGNRTKLIYKNGSLINAMTGEKVESWSYSEEIIVPPDYSVYLKLVNGHVIIIHENEKAVWIESENTRNPVQGTNSDIRLPDFHEYRYGSVMKVLNNEILINVLDSKPLPNFFVYKNPWRRDGAMMAMCLKATGNIDLIKKWALSLDDPFDRNNGGETEADNLGQTLYLMSFFTDKNHPLISKILNEAKKFEIMGRTGKYIKGRSDFHETPVYQTKWLKYGLKSMDLPDDFIIPGEKDDYSALFWMDFRTCYEEGTKDADDKGNYPYLGWACDHFHHVRKSPVSNRDYPLTWETRASQADYSGMKIIDQTFFDKKTASPHTWHASEIFLYLMEFKKE